MSDRRDDILDTLTESKRLVGDLELPTGEEYSINSILTEFGQDAAEPAPEEGTAPEAMEQTGPIPRSACVRLKAFHHCRDRRPRRSKTSHPTASDAPSLSHFQAPPLGEQSDRRSD